MHLCQLQREFSASSSNKALCSLVVRAEEGLFAIVEDLHLCPQVQK